MEEEKEFESIRQELRKAGIRIKHEYFSKENPNKLKTYIFNLTNAVTANNPERFMQIVVSLYGSLGRALAPNDAFGRIGANKREFRNLALSYISGLECYVEEDNNTKNNNKGENRNEE